MQSSGKSAASELLYRQNRASGNRSIVSLGVAGYYVKNACTFDSFSPREGSGPRYTSPSILSPFLSLSFSSSLLLSLIPLPHPRAISNPHLSCLSPSTERPGGSNPSSRDSSFLPFHPFSLRSLFNFHEIRTSRYEHGAHTILRGGGENGGQEEGERKEGVVNGTRVTAQKAKVIEHDLSVGRHFYRRPFSLIFKGCSYDVRFLRGVARASATHASAGIYAHPYVSDRCRN